MCGIIAILSILPNINKIIEGLMQLQNRGYDSAGISYITNKLSIIKFATTSNIDSIEKIKINSVGILSNNTIAHTRWATHGAKNDINSHPHLSYCKKISLVHNGIIENYKILKDFLIKNDYEFKSQTDTEVIVNLISYYYKETNCPYESINKTICMLEGTWGLAIQFLDHPNKIFSIRHGSPLLLGISNDNLIITSELSGFNGLVNNYFILDNNDLLELNISNNKLNYITNKKYTLCRVNKINFDLTPAPYKYWMEKEINEQLDSCLRAICMGGRINKNLIKLGGLELHKDIIKDINNIILLGCGTSYNAGMCGHKYLKSLNKFNSISCYDGAEFTKNDIPKMGKTALILLSQSGETKDLHRCIDIAREENLFMIGIVNVVDSMIAREVDCGIYLNAGREVSVASTKSFTSQIIILQLLSIWLAQLHKINFNNLEKINSIRKFSYDIKYVLNLKDTIREKCKLLNNKSMFILGKGINQYIANEGALKIKEISYIHAEGYSGSSLKHGPFSLLEKNFPVILLIMNDNYKNKMLNVYEEIKSRHAEILVITNDCKLYIENKIVIPKNNYPEVLSIIVLQYISFYLGLLRHTPIDKPRNLAKCVTVY